MATQVNDPERVQRHEMRTMREQIRAIVTNRIAGVACRPLDEIPLPAAVLEIARTLIAEFDERYPDGLPSDPARLGEIIAIAERYGREAVARFDQVIAGQFELEPVTSEAS